MWKNKKKSWQSMKVYSKDFSLEGGGGTQPKNSNNITNLFKRHVLKYIFITYNCKRESKKEKRMGE